MARLKLHKVAAVLVLAGATAWIATGEFSSAGSVEPADEAAPERVEQAVAPTTVGVVVPPRVAHARAIRIAGETEADKRATLVSRLAGTVESLPVEQGDAVAAGDLIVRLEAEGKQAAVDTARQLVVQREAEAEAAERLAASGNLPKLRLEEARSALAAARSQLESAEADLERTTLEAPFSGIVDRIRVEEGAAVMQGSEIATLLQLDPVIAVGEVSERDLGYLAVGDAAEVRLVSGETRTGTVRYISRAASPQTRTFRVEVAVDNPERAVPAGMTTEVTLRATPVEAVVLPRSVVTLSNEGDLGVRAVDAENRVVFYPIDLVDDTPQGLVLGGVPADARIIVAGQDLVSEGETVNAVEADAETIRSLVGGAAAAGGTR
ncbi:efflux RND transporter periplasmic adaptor subunit [Aquibium sp. A9E412]|uniref:efflux RND transporter periplasmic adaptor subunit n=1 Tax=Aquibium sp. A9E412 TaxID=2976767 RepID=UPI0025B23E32|nr:efflux RND transporter periplasmic adaptor subunit [Aquibium sp. A9E412]MDN2567000.1 efflux RND transporter periplasmic adaptor subunit [Aquibium sp. A9E412]